MKKLIFALLGIVSMCSSGYCDTKLIAQEGKGFLEEKDGQFILHVKGTPFEMGVQHGKLMKDKIEHNIKTYIDQKKPEFQDRYSLFEESLASMIEYIPLSYIEEMEGIAQGSGIPYDKIVRLNLFPEMFHCSGIVVSGDATKDGTLFHVRVLDYAMGKDVQKTNVVIIAEPNEKISFVNVSYAGFIGTITGMNSQKISIGEIGGLGYGYWDGIPMSFLLREVLENAVSINGVKTILESKPRTCEYYYVFADGKSNQSVGVYATASQIHFIEPGSSYAMLAPHNLPKNYGKDGKNDKFFLSSYRFDETSHLKILYGEHLPHIALFCTQPKDSLVLTGYSYPERYPVIIERLLASYGQIDSKVLQGIIKQPVARNSNLHNAIFAPQTLELWLAHANDTKPACDEPYIHLDVKELFSH